MTPDSEAVRRTALVTGGEGVLARAVAAELARACWLVRAPARRDLDVTDAGAVSRFFSATGRLDLLVCAAGVTRDKPAVSLPAADWDSVLAVNLDGAFRCARAAVPLMTRQGGGHIVFIGSHSAVTGNPGQTAYAAAKSALEGLTRSLARELGPSGIRVNCLLPGFFDSKMTRALTPKARQRLLDDHALGAPTTPGDTARFLVFLDTMHTVSGQTFHLDSRLARWA